jgi:hypothetical protein
MINYIQFHTVGQTPCWKLGRKTTQNHAISDENAAPKTQRKPGFWGDGDLAQPTIILQEQTSKSATQNIKMRNIIHVQQGSNATFFTLVVVYRDSCRDMLHKAV